MKITLKTLPQATAQQVFDQVKNHLLKQGEKSLSLNRSCRYRGCKGTKCAAGCLISDKEYRIEMEGGTWGGLADQGDVPGIHLELIDDLQRVHDKISVELWENSLERVAKDHGLNYD